MASTPQFLCWNAVWMGIANQEKRLFLLDKVVLTHVPSRPNALPIPHTGCAWYWLSPMDYRHRSTAVVAQAQQNSIKRSALAPACETL
eukprot:3606676-Amphidinium_carterae.1